MNCHLQVLCVREVKLPRSFLFYIATFLSNWFYYMFSSVVSEGLKIQGENGLRDQSLFKIQ